jgi:hypothetical protein
MAEPPINRNVFILGAGFSANAAAPVIIELARFIQKISALANRQFCPVKVSERMNTVRQRVRRSQLWNLQFGIACRSDRDILFSSL